MVISAIPKLAIPEPEKFWLQTHGLRDDVDPDNGVCANDFDIGDWMEMEDGRVYRCFQMNSAVFRKNDGIYYES